MHNQLVVSNHCAEQPPQVRECRVMGAGSFVPGSGSRVASCRGLIQCERRPIPRVSDSHERQSNCVVC